MMGGKLEPRCFDGMEPELADDIVACHDAVVAKSGFNPAPSARCREVFAEQVQSVIYSVFGTIYGSKPDDRYADLFVQMADFAIHLSRDHIFPDGNKRTTVISTMALLKHSGFILQVEDAPSIEDNELYDWIENVVRGLAGLDELAGFLRCNCAPLF